MYHQIQLNQLFSMIFTRKIHLEIMTVIAKNNKKKATNLKVILNEEEYYCNNSKSNLIFVVNKKNHHQTLSIKKLSVEGSKLSLTEQELVNLLQKKDKNAFSLLYDNYSSALYGVICKIIRIEEVAQDVLQDSFVKIWKNIASYKPEKGALFTWLLNIARNTAIDKFRSAEYKQIIQAKSFEANLLNKNTENQIPIEHIGLQKIIESLKYEYQEVIDIVYFQGFTHIEAAEHLNLPLGTVKTRIKIALRELRKLTFS